MISRGIKLKFGGIEERLAINAINRRASIEYMKIKVVVNAIISAANIIASAVTGSDGGGLDSLNKSLDHLGDMMLPHMKEEKDKQANRMKEIMVHEASQGPMKVKVVGKDKSGNRRRR